MACANFTFSPSKAKHSAIETSAFDQTVVVLVAAIDGRAGLLHAKGTVAGRKSAGVVGQGAFAERPAVGIEIHEFYVLGIAPVVEHRQLEVAAGSGCF